jgi:hypothetical protein
VIVQSGLNHKGVCVLIMHLTVSLGTVV